jgi:hypothetical protein
MHLLTDRRIQFAGFGVGVEWRGLVERRPHTKPASQRKRQEMNCRVTNQRIRICMTREPRMLQRLSSTQPFLAETPHTCTRNNQSGVPAPPLSTRINVASPPCDSAQDKYAHTHASLSVPHKHTAQHTTSHTAGSEVSSLDIKSRASLEHGIAAGNQGPHPSYTH